MTTEPENPSECRDRKLRELEGKNVGHYVTMLSAYIQYGLQLDKLLITLASAGIGLIVTILIASHPRGGMTVCFSIGSILAFLITIALRLFLLQEHRNWIESDLKGTRDVHDKIDKRITQLELFSAWSFVAAVVFTACIGLSPYLHDILYPPYTDPSLLR